MSDHKISMRQVLTLLFASLLSPMVRVLPGRTAALAGRAGWLSALPALPVLLALVWVLCALLRDSGEGLAQCFRRVLGRGVGRALTLAYLLWGVLLLCMNARQFGLRFLSTGYRNAPLPLFVTALLAAALWLVRKRLPAVARAGEIFYLALALALGFSLFLGGFRVEVRNVLPVWTQDILGVLRGAGPTLAVLGYVVFGGFLGGHVARREENRRRALRWACAFCGVLTAFQWTCLGCFGPGLTQRLDIPFFMMVKGVGVEGAFERIESVIIALWVLSDLALLALLLLACSAMAGELFPLREERSAALPLALLALVGALFLLPNGAELDKWMAEWIVPGNLLFGFGVPVAVWLVDALRRRKQR